MGYPAELKLVELGHEIRPSYIFFQLLIGSLFSITLSLSLSLSLSLALPQDLAKEL
jgi:hypothetical protein